MTRAWSGEGGKGREGGEGGGMGAPAPSPKPQSPSGGQRRGRNKLWMNAGEIVSTRGPSAVFIAGRKAEERIQEV